MGKIRAVLMDIDGVLAVSWRPLPGAADAVRAVREAGYPIALVTNTSSQTRAWIAARLAESGFPVTEPEILTVAALTAEYLAEHHPGARCLLLNDGDLSADLPGVTLTGPRDPAPDVVILGGAGPQFDYDTLNLVFAHLRGGACLIAMNQNLYWATEAGLRLDTGAFLPGLEQASGVTAEVTGKPAPAFFEAALACVNAAPEETIMVGDDLHGDVLAAQRLGITGVLVRTGKFREETLASAPAAPDHVLGSVADLPALLSQLS